MCMIRNVSACDCDYRNRPSACSIMSVIWSNEQGWLVCHSLFLRKIYSCVGSDLPCSTCGRYRVFHIDHPFLKRGQKSIARFDFHDNQVPNANKDADQKPEDDDDQKNIASLGNYSAGDFKLIEAFVLPTVFRKFMRELWSAKLEYFVQEACPGALAGNISAIDAANTTLSRAAAAAAAAFGDENYDGANFNDHAVVANVKNETYFIPSRCRFYNYDVGKMVEKLDRSTSPPYDLVLIDPPWPNKHVKRKNASSNAASGYNLMKADRLAELPIDDYLSESGLLAVWCTNSAQHVDALINRLFPRWKVQYVGTWYWIKVTQSAQPICEFANVAVRRSKKQPFERIIFASRIDRCNVHENPPPNKILVSIPSAIHSHKPPLTEVLKEYLPANCRRIELFARYLLPDWTSYGNEVLKLQSSSLFV